ncbi:hypothetical protein [Dokdonella fugitiva]|uniref:hypothetical protein n=1 Tax=Dokdonella fugitiva TaxID=328517 RepID=UPI0015FA4957|nr:hypothetical protein [Dokdonella fugitiva]MBA8882894.1 hypothetical protein [Dokdonella fugitiva]
MQRQTVLVVAAVVAAMATAWWLWPLQPIRSQPLASRPAPAPEPPPPPAAPAPSSVTRVAAVESSAAPPPAELPPSAVKPVEAAVQVAPPAPAPAPAPSPTPPAQAPVADAPTAPAQAEPEAQAPPDAAGATPGADAEEPSAIPPSADDTGDGGAAEAPATIDEDHAIDLFAERMAALEQAGDGEEEGESRDAAMQKEFDGRGDGGDDAATRARELRGHLQAWVAELPSDPPHDVLLASVECRTGSCRVLLAEGGVDLSGQPETPGSAAVNALQASFLALRSAEWWTSLQLGEASLSMHAADPATAPGYVLWTIYIGVAT